MIAATESYYKTLDGDTIYLLVRHRCISGDYCTNMQFREPVTGDRGDRPRLAILAQRACCIGSTLGSLSFVRFAPD